MARITVEDCLEQEPNRFSLVQLASKRSKQLLTGARPLVDIRKGNKAVVNSLREIASGLVRFKTEADLEKEREIEEKRRLFELQQADLKAAKLKEAGESSDGSKGGAKSDSSGHDSKLSTNISNADALFSEPTGSSGSGSNGDSKSVSAEDESEE